MRLSELANYAKPITMRVEVVLGSKKIPFQPATCLQDLFEAVGNVGIPALERLHSFYHRFFAVLLRPALA